MTTLSLSFRRLRLAALALAGGALLALAGCAAGPNPHDPLEPFNREVSKFNEGVDAVVLKPTATLYREKMPPLVRTGVSNFFGNLGDAWSSVNSLLQFKLQNAAEDWMRFSFNTVFGFAGVLDIASEMNIDRHREDFGQTLGRWGVPAGPYVVLPLLGPSTLRDTLALPVDWQGDPLYYVTPSTPRDSLYALRLVDVRSNLLRAGDVLEGAALDKYSFTRDAYLQRRRAEVFESGTRSEDPNEGSDADSGGADSGKADESRGGAGKADASNDDGQIPPEPKDDAPKLQPDAGAPRPADAAKPDGTAKPDADKPSH